jgi:putative PIN family toxin of toxin-antitoxin system
VIRAVVDTSVLISAFVGEPTAGPGRLVEAWRDQRFVLVASPGLFAELDDVLARPKLERWASDGRGQAYVDGFRARCEQHADSADPPPMVRDAADDYLVALVRSSAADVLVSLDRDLLDASLPDLTVLDPAQFLGRLA